jgi:hypothetical protein
MAKLIDKVLVKNGRLIKVLNMNKPKFSNANNTYYAIWVENANGHNERCLLLTEKEIKVAENRAMKNKEDLTSKNLLLNILD